MLLTTTTVGDGARTAALVHGMTASSLHWARLLIDEHDCTVTLVDLRGHGDSPRAERYHLPDFADDLADTLPQGLDLLIGQSLGGRSVIEAAARLQPKRLIALDPALTTRKLVALAFRVLVPVQVRLPDAALRRIGFPPPRSAPDAMQRVRAGWSKWDRAVLRSLTSSVSQYPFVVESTRLVPDSGGAGRWRGGLGIESVIRMSGPARLTVRGDRMRVPPRGIQGGAPGAPGSWTVKRVDGTVETLLPRQADVLLAAGDVLVVRTSGGGGLGDPAERVADAHEVDVREGRVSA